MRPISLALPNERKFTDFLPFYQKPFSEERHHSSWKCSEERLMNNSKRWDFVPGEPRYPPTLVSHLSSQFPWAKDDNFMLTFSKLLADIRKICNSKKGNPFVLPGSSSFATEFALINLLEPEDVVLVIGKGSSSQFMASIAQNFANAVDFLPIADNAELIAEHLSAKLEEKPYKVILVPHVEMSTGTLLPIDEVEPVVKEFKAFLVIDTHASVGAHAVPKADVVTAGSNWGLGGPPGLSIILASERVLEERKNRSGHYPSRYLDMMTWAPIMENYLACEVVPPTSVPTFLIHSLAFTTGEIAKDLEKYQQRHERFSRIFRTSLAKIGLKLVQENHELAARTFTVFQLPEDVKPGTFITAAAKIGLRLDRPTKGKDTREISVGHAGYLTDDDLLSLVFHLEQALTNVGVEPKENGLAFAGEALHGKSDNSD
jgi:alanine-glyoxylate transaminase/serine-glyoxylate transaminase/serine-pyruvate transaminase